MKIRLLLLNLLCVFCVNVLLAGSPSYIETKDGVIVYTDSVYTGTSNAVKLEVVSDNIIRVIVSPVTEITVTQSLVTVYTRKPDLSWDVIPSKEFLTLKTKNITAIVHLKTGVVSFQDNTGKKILTEKPIGGRSFQSAVFDGKRYYNLRQTFKTTSDEGWYGLVIQTAPDEYIVAGITARLKFGKKDPSRNIRLGQVFEGKFEGEQWVTTRMLNGDETWQHDCVLVTGRKAMISHTTDGQIIPPQPGPNQPALESAKNTEVQTPAVYKVITYEMK